ncbi:hypothetical protein HQ563_10620 [bacterium]|nr:hypothetical protein [bacterium]
MTRREGGYRKGKSQKLNRLPHSTDAKYRKRIQRAAKRWHKKRGTLTPGMKEKIHSTKDEGPRGGKEQE